jgi:tetratricopeptide (TPR) repeat protein
LAGCAGVKQDRAQRVFATQERAEALYQQRDFARALPEYQALVKALPDSPHGWLRLGNCHAQLEHYREAVLAYQRAIALDNSFSSAWINLAYVQSHILSQTVAAMYQQVSPQDPRAQRVQRLVDGVLAPFAESAPARPALEPEAPINSAPAERVDSAPQAESEVAR